MEIELTFWAKIDVTNRSSKTKHRNQILNETHLPSNLCHLFYVNHKILWSGGQSLKSKDFGEFLHPWSLDKKGRVRRRSEFRKDSVDWWW